MMEGQQGYEKPTSKKEKMNNMNNQNLALKSVHLTSLYL